MVNGCYAVNNGPTIHNFTYLYYEGLSPPVFYCTVNEFCCFLKLSINTEFLQRNCDIHFVAIFPSHTWAIWNFSFSTYKLATPTCPPTFFEQHDFWLYNPIFNPLLGNFNFFLNAALLPPFVIHHYFYYYDGTTTGDASAIGVSFQQSCSCTIVHCCLQHYAHILKTQDVSMNNTLGTYDGYAHTHFKAQGVGTVSYTHLTLPTILLV